MWRKRPDSCVIVAHKATQTHGLCALGFIQVKASGLVQVFNPLPDYGD